MSPAEVPVVSKSQIVALLGVLCSALLKSLDRHTRQFSNLWTSLPESIQEVMLIFLPVGVLGTMSDSVRSVSVDQLLRILIGYWMVSFISLAWEPECPQLPWPDHNEPALLQTLIEPVGGQEVDHRLSKQLADPLDMWARLQLNDLPAQPGVLDCIYIKLDK